MHVLRAGKKQNETRKIIINFENEANEFLSEHLSKKGYWGRSETLKAIKLIYKVNIMIIKEKSSVEFVNDFTPEFEKSLLVAYRLNRHPNIRGTGSIRNHYDSIVNIQSETMIQLSSTIVSKEENKLEDLVIVELESE